MVEPFATNSKKLFATVGLPRSGKSTWAQSIGLPMVNPDSIRLGLHGHAFIQEAEPFVWATAKLMVRSLFIAGHDIVILDATNVSEGQRKAWLWPDLWTTYWKIFDTPKDVCIERAVAGGRQELVDIIERFSVDLTFPTENLIS